jgi:hypothetical protein
VTVLPFEPRPKPEPPMCEGEARCLACKHEWRAVFPPGASDLECPACSLLRAVPKWPFSGSSGYVWVCHCGNDLFRLTPQSAICVGCGDMPEDYRKT